MKNYYVPMNTLNFLSKFFTIYRAILLAIISPGIALAQGNESNPSSPNWTWQVFGDGFYGGSAVKRNNEIFIDVNWLKATWGLGISYKLEWPEENRELDRIRIQIKSVFNTNAKVLAGISSKAGENKEQDPRLAQDITNQWQTFEFTTSGMLTSRSSDRLVPSLHADDPKGLQVINLSFLKAEGSDLGSDTIVVRDLVVMFKNGESYAYQGPN